MINKIKSRYTDENRVYIISWILFIGSFLWLLKSLSMDIDTLYEHNFVQRSGSILVLAGVLVEYSLLRISMIKDGPFGLSPMVEKIKVMPKRYNIIKILAHMYVLIGTYIWGYADLFR